MFLNLSLLEVLGIFSAITAFSIALYLLDRNRRRQVVATLRFWVEQGRPAPVTRRHRIQQPFSLVLQLLGMLFLLLAIAQFQFGGSRTSRHDHVLILDTSAWMGAALPDRPGATLMDLARSEALGWLRAVPFSDRVMLIRGDALATPVTSWELDHRNVARAILESQPGSTALNLSQSLQFATRMQQGSGSLPGEVVYAGPGRISARESNALSQPNIPALRVLNVGDSIENAGLRSVGARRSVTDLGTWEVLVRVRNYGRMPRAENVTLNFGKAPEGVHTLQIPPGEEGETSFSVRTNSAGILEARLYPKDAFAADNYASLELPSLRTLHVIVYSDRPELLRPALASDSRLAADFRATSAYTPDNDGLIVLDRFRPRVSPKGAALWIDPPVENSPVPIRERVEHPGNIQWTPDQPLTAGLRTRDLEIDSASVFEAATDDIKLAATDKGPVMIARVSNPGSRLVAIGFDPFASGMRYELAAPLLVGNILRWAAPDIFRDLDIGAQSAGAVASPVADEKAPVQVLTESGASLPFNIRDRAVQFFAGNPARVRVISGNSERVYSLTLPEMWDSRWTPPANARRGIPASNDAIRRNLDPWPFLAGLGAALLIAEWILYGRHSTERLHIIRSKREAAA